MKLALSLLKTLPAELAHSLALNGLKFLDKLGLISLFVKEIKNNELELSGMKFKNNLGTAAGLDKNGDYINSLGHGICISPSGRFEGGVDVKKT